MQMENVPENILSEAPASFICIKGVVSLSNHLHAGFPVLSPPGKASLGYSLEKSMLAAQLRDPLHVKEDPLHSFTSLASSVAL